MLRTEQRDVVLRTETQDPSGDQQILLVEDNRGDARLLEVYLSGLPFVVTNVPTVAAAVAQATVARYDLVVADLGLPDSVGLETFHRIHAAFGRTTPIVVLSGTGDESLAVDAVAAGAQDYLPKNELSAAVLTRTIRYAIERHRMRRSMEHVERLAGLGRLAARMAHEFNNVLMGVLPWAQVIAMSSRGNARVEKAASQVMDAVKRGKQITFQVLDYARPSEPNKTTFDAGAWLVAAAQDLEPTLRCAKQLVVTAPPAEVFVSADRTQLTQVLCHLVRNADEADNGGAPIRVSLTQSGPTSVEIAVTDEGTGIPVATREHIFEPMFSTKPKGTGLGLAIAFQIVSSHDGTIAVEANQPRGSRFVVTLPAVQHVAAAEHADAGDGPRIGRVLIVDDEMDAAEGLKWLLERTVDEVEIVGTARDALSVVPRFRPDLLLLDVGLPDMSGLDVLRQLEHQPPMVIFATGHVQHCEVEPLLGQGIGHLTKPYSVDELWRTVKLLSPR